MSKPKRKPTYSSLCEQGFKVFGVNNYEFIFSKDGEHFLYLPPRQSHETMDKDKPLLLLATLTDAQVAIAHNLPLNASLSLRLRDGRA